MITTLKDMLDYGTDTLQKAGKADSRSDAWYLLSYCMKMSRAEFYMKQNTEMDEKDIASYKKLIDIRTDGMPLQYITGSHYPLQRRQLQLHRPVSFPQVLPDKNRFLPYPLHNVTFSRSWALSQSE